MTLRSIVYIYENCTCKSGEFSNSKIKFCKNKRIILVIEFLMTEKYKETKCKLNLFIPHYSSFLHSFCRIPSNKFALFVCGAEDGIFIPVYQHLA
jgi:hypothetical protein